MTGVDPNNGSSFTVRVIPSDLTETAPVKSEIFSTLERLQYDENGMFAIKLALEEALVNAIRHGNRNDPSKEVRVQFALSEEKAEFIIGDQGDGFLPDDIPDCTSPDRLSLPSGRGIMLIRAYTDDVCYRDKGREIYFMRMRESSAYPKDEDIDAAVRQTIFFEGRVQGVGFRCTAQAIAARFSITGTVQNLPDGRVQVIAEGSLEEIDNFRAELTTAMKGKIEDTRVTASPATGAFSDFSITS